MKYPRDIENNDRSIYRTFLIMRVLSRFKVTGGYFVEGLGFGVEGLKD